MIELLAVLITVGSVTGVLYLLEQATGVWAVLKAWWHVRLRPWAPPHAKAEPTDDGDKEKQC